MGPISMGSGCPPVPRQLVNATELWTTSWKKKEGVMNERRVAAAAQRE